MASATAGTGRSAAQRRAVGALPVGLRGNVSPGGQAVRGLLPSRAALDGLSRKVS